MSSEPTPCGGSVVLPVPPTPASSSQSPAVAEVGSFAAVGDAPARDLSPRPGGLTLFPLNKNLKRKRVATKSLPEAWTAPTEIAGQK
eukprot:2763944-Alexandrium_andersonii.AAC.1